MHKIFLTLLVLVSSPVWAGILAHPDALTLPVVEIEAKGRPCPEGGGGNLACHHIITTIYDNGKCTGECRRPQISDNEVGDLQGAITTADFSAFKQKTPGTCLPSMAGGQGVIYTFRAENGDQRVDTCEYDVDRALEPFKTLMKILRNHDAEKD